jgi:WD40 repeat protein
MKITKVQKVAAYLGHSNAIYCISFDKDTQTLYSGSADGLIVEWKPGLSENGISLVRVNAPVWSMLKHKHKLYIGTSKGNIHIIDLLERKEIRNIELHNKGVFQIVHTSYGIFTAGADGSVAQWDLDFNLILRKKISDKSIRHIEPFPDNSGLLLACSDHTIYKINYKAEICSVWKGHTLSVFTLCFLDTKSNNFISGGRDAVLKIWDQNKEIETIAAHLYAIYAISLSPCGKFVATSSMDKTIKIWDSTTFKLLKVIDYAKNQAHTNCVNKVLWVDNSSLISCSDDRQILHFKIEYEYDPK